ncbi:MAG: hypothetical protein CFE21_11920 [Bacteroidetes bacterium B1(2017)]|nr:MAG: hypothetical protein CFE21_11920 [Bacteroidetes bacterium B1(2017)]
MQRLTTYLLKPKLVLGYKPQAIILVILFFIGSITKILAQENKDTLFLHNGIIVHGEFKKISLGRVYFDAEDIGLFNLKTNAIDYLVANTQLYRINTTSKEIIFSKIYKSNEAGVLVFKVDSTLKEIPLTKISSISYFFEKDSLRNLEGNISVGFTYTKSSDVGRYNIDGQLKYLMKKSDFALAANTISTQSKGTWNRDRENLKFLSQTFYSPTFRGLGIANYQRNLELGLSRRFQEGYAIAYNAFSTSEMDGFIGTGILVNQERSIEGNETNHLEIPLLLQYDFFRLNSPEITIIAGSGFYYSLNQNGRKRQENELKISWEIISDFSVDLKTYSSYDSKPPSAKANKIDYGIVFGLGYSFN